MGVSLTFIDQISTHSAFILVRLNESRENRIHIFDCWVSFFCAFYKAQKWNETRGSSVWCSKVNEWYRLLQSKIVCLSLKISGNIYLSVRTIFHWINSWADKHQLPPVTDKESKGYCWILRGPISGSQIFIFSFNAILKTLQGYAKRPTQSL